MRPLIEEKLGHYFFLTATPACDYLTCLWLPLIHTVHTIFGGQYLAGWSPRKTIRSSDLMRPNVEIWSVNKYIWTRKLWLMCDNIQKTIFLNVSVLTIKCWCQWQHCSIAVIIHKCVCICQMIYTDLSWIKL